MLNDVASVAVGRSRERGAVLFLAIIVLVLMTLATVALVRWTGTANLIAGNMAFQQSAMLTADLGFQDAITYLEGAGTALNNDDSSHGYAANGLTVAQRPASGQSWDAYWTATLASRPPVQIKLAQGNTGNLVEYVIDRLCEFAGPQTGGANCAKSPMLSADPPNEQKAESVGLKARSLVYYRITARVSGPRNTVSYVQAIVAF